MDAPEDPTNVYAVERGIVVREDPILGRVDDRIIVIHHYPLELGFISRYLHVKNPFVSVKSDSNEVDEGQKIAVVGSTSTPHLHFEIRQLFLSPSSLNIGDRNVSLPLDPTMLLYQLEITTSTSTNEHNETPALISRMREDFRKRMRFITVEMQNNSSQFFIPLYNPSLSDLSLIATIREAFFTKKQVRIRWRDSLFFADIKTDSGDFAKTILEAHIVP